MVKIPALFLTAFFATAIFSTALLSVNFAEASTLVKQSQLYSSDVLYDVLRNDKPVGEYSLRFRSSSAERVSVEVDMQISTKVFGLFSYDYRYSALEIWDADELQSLDVKIVTNGDEQRVRASREGPQLQVIDPDGETTNLPSNILTTHHWFNSILEQPQVLNTIKGEVSLISVKAESEASWSIDGQIVPVTGYRLGGDLSNTLSWYDNQGRWRGMTFTARDGSTIDVRWRGAKLGLS